MINKQLVMRYEGNPILTKHDIPYTVETVHNAAATKYEDQYILLFRSHLRNGRSILGIARSDDGYKFHADYLQRLFQVWRTHRSGENARF